MTRTATGVDPRVRRTRRLLLGAFEELLAEKGFQALTVQDVAERAEVELGRPSTPTSTTSTPCSTTTTARGSRSGWRAPSPRWRR